MPDLSACTADAMEFIALTFYHLSARAVKSATTSSPACVAVRGFFRALFKVVYFTRSIVHGVALPDSTDRAVGISHVRVCVVAGNVLYCCLLYRCRISYQRYKTSWGLGGGRLVGFVLM